MGFETVILVKAILYPLPTTKARVHVGRKNDQGRDYRLWQGRLAPRTRMEVKYKLKPNIKIDGGGGATLRYPNINRE